ncbi:uncharacterized protein LOC114525113 [Dendronephthya gigantea]|uniref:uncharacterized protein LOC114525113 n=1 Tax=Dendronephthya gigantea TaxID=151771 RepID=UPI00106A0501|nr:uncharacterized protein LOC114525113 [Dendronephthya gigantea]
MNTETIERFYEYICQCCDSLISESPDTSITVTGDFNPESNGFQERVLKNHCKLKQVVKTPTRGNAILDLILTNAHLFYERPISLAPIGFSDHCAIIWKSKEQTQSKNEVKKITVRPIKEARLFTFEECIGQETWSAVYDAPCIDTKVQESYATEWIYEDVHDKISGSQFGGLPGTSTIHALIYLLHKWYKAMDSPGKIVRIMFLDFRKAYDLIDHNLLLDNFIKIGVRPAMVGWFASYLTNRSQVTSFQGEQSDRKRVKGGVPQGSKLGPIAFIIKINQLPASIASNDQDQTRNAVEEQDAAMFMDDTTISEVINVIDHLDDQTIGNTRENVDKVV